LPSFTGTGNSICWTNDNPNIGLAAMELEKYLYLLPATQELVNLIQQPLCNSIGSKLCIISDGIIIPIFFSFEITATGLV